MATLRRLSALVALTLAVPAGAAPLSVQIKDAGGHAVADAAITVVADPGTPDLPRSNHAPATHIIDQKNETFVPYVETFRPGDKVVFRNSDVTRHHVYSFSAVKSFEMVLVPGQSSLALTLERTGLVAVGCNIHDHMIAYLYISDAPRLARSGADGRAQIADLPAGTYAVKVWHPQLPGQSEWIQHVKVSAAGEPVSAVFVVSLLPDPRGQQDPERSGY